MKNQKIEKLKEIVFNSILNTPNADYFVYGVQTSILAAFKPFGW